MIGRCVFREVWDAHELGGDKRRVVVHCLQLLLLNANKQTLASEATHVALLVDGLGIRVRHGVNWLSAPDVGNECRICIQKGSGKRAGTSVCVKLSSQHDFKDGRNLEFPTNGRRCDGNLGEATLNTNETTSAVLRLD